MGSLTNQEIMSHPYIHFGTSVARGSRTRGLNVAFGSLRPFGPGSNVARKGQNIKINQSAKIKKNHKLLKCQDNITTIYESSHNYTIKYNLKNINEYGIDAIEDKKLKDGIHTIESIKFDLDFNTL